MPWYKEAENDIRHHKKEVIMVIGTVVLVVFAYLAYRKAKGGGSSVPASNTSGVTDAVGNPIDQTGASIANAIKSQTGVLDQISKRIAASNRKLRNLNKKEAHDVKVNQHMEAQLKKLAHAAPPKKATHPSTKAGHQAKHGPSGASLVKNHPW